MKSTPTVSEFRTINYEVGPKESFEQALVHIGTWLKNEKYPDRLKHLTINIIKND